MIEISENLYVGAQTDLVHALDHDHIDGKEHVKSNWFVISSAKEPWHRQALGYTSRAVAKDHPEYLIAHRPGRLILNLVDVDDPAYIRSEIVEAAMTEIDRHLADGKKVLIHCNQGQSRAPTLGLLYLRRTSADYADLTHEQGAAMFRATYPAYAPAKGMALYSQQHWDDHVAGNF